MFSIANCQILSLQTEATQYIIKFMYNSTKTGNAQGECSLSSTISIFSWI